MVQHPDTGEVSTMSLTTKEKTCSRCKKTKSINEFYVSSRRKDGLDYWCKTCRKKYQLTERGKESHKKALKKYRQSKKGKIMAKRAGKKYREPEERKIAHKEYNREWYRRKGRDYSLRFNYGITLKQYEEMLKQQNEVCAVCSEVNLNGKLLCVDHNHKTGKVRGLLCDSCNHVLGMGKENVDRLAKAILYLKKHN